jgi:hypothetical protein
LVQVVVERVTVLELFINIARPVGDGAIDDDAQFFGEPTIGLKVALAIPNRARLVILLNPRDEALNFRHRRLRADRGELLAEEIALADRDEPVAIVGDFALELADPADFFACHIRLL